MVTIKLKIRLSENVKGDYEFIKDIIFRRGLKKSGIIILSNNAFPPFFSTKTLYLDAAHWQ